MMLTLKGGDNTRFEFLRKMTLTNILSFDHNKQNLQLPDLPDDYLEITLIDNEEDEVEDLNQSYPLAVSDVTEEDILDAKKLTNGEGVKEIYLMELSTNYSSYKPGDTVGIVSRNREEDVQNLIAHLGISHLAKKKCKVHEKVTPMNKNPTKPFLEKITTLEYIFTYCLDIQSIPKKSLIRILAEFAKDAKEKHQLEELCSKEGSERYTKEILNVNKTFLDLLLAFPSCCPPAVRLIENLPNLQPRPYSVASSPLYSPNKVKIIFSVINIDDKKEGLCTGMLKNMINKKTKEENKVRMFFRKCNGFSLPDTDVPLILIGPGTGIAPFMGFLEHRKIQQVRGKIWLFYGCRHKAKDYLFKKELGSYLENGVLTKLSVSFSRDNDEDAKYVQDNIKKNGKEICDLIFKENAMIYVCGDAKNMKKDIQNAFIEIIQSYHGVSYKEALESVKKLQKEKRYLQDIWF